MAHVSNGKAKAAAQQERKVDDSGRDVQGKFTPGNAGGPGNPFARRVAHLRSVMVQAISDEDIAAIIVKLMEQARAGDAASAKVLFQYVIGKPTVAPNPDRMDRDEYEVAREAPRYLELGVDLNRPPFKISLGILKCMEMVHQRQLLETLRTGKMPKELVSTEDAPVGG
jgi:hypothetical protein